MELKAWAWGSLPSLSAMLSSGSRLRGNRRCKRESVLFVGTQFSILYTSQVNGVMVCGEVVDLGITLQDLTRWNWSALMRQ